MRAKFVLEAIKHLTPKDMSEKDFLIWSLEKFIREPINYDKTNLDAKGYKRIWIDGIVHFTHDPAIEKWIETNTRFEVILFKNFTVHTIIYLKDKKLDEVIKHLQPRTQEELKKIVYDTPIKDRLEKAVRLDVRLTNKELEDWNKELYDWIMKEQPDVREKLAIRYSIKLTPKDLEKTKKEIIIKYKKIYGTQYKLDRAFLFNLKWYDWDNIKLLIDAGADVNLGEGRPFRVAAEDGRIKLAKYLIANGADPTLKNNLAEKILKRSIKNVKTDAKFRWHSDDIKNDVLKWMQILKLIRSYENKNK